ncbi:protein FAM228A isoform X2 [Etheostoma spectabile]|uniref:protein FAM228A isoform X2 n=1 Tax=Etheostoma spectabile TaxID=54343 RepID=UPI0013AF2B8B|nr:protein FAM228B isoform X2 [Etheostoma spectabile]
MSSKKNSTASGVITFHSPFHVSLIKSEECMDIGKSPSQPSKRTRSTSKCVRAEKKDESSPSGPQPGATQHRLSHTSLRRLQAKMEDDNQQVKATIQAILDTENGFMKLERFLSQRDITELRRRELLHKRWTERVWFPLQRRVEKHVSSCSPVAVKRHLSLYRQYLHQCNTKGVVLLESYDLREYNPFLLHNKKPHYIKLRTADVKDPLYLQLHERLKEKRTARSCEEGCQRQVEKQPQSDRPLSESVTSQANMPLHASSNHPVTASRKTPVVDETEGRKSSRINTIPCRLRTFVTPNGMCHQTGCWFSRCRQQAASVQQLQSSPTSK